MKKAIRSLVFAALASALISLPAAATSTLYDNTGPLSDVANPPAEIGAEPIFATSAISDSFAVPTNSTATAFNFDVWLIEGDSLTSVNWDIGTTNISEFGGAAGNTASGASLTLAPAANPTHFVNDTNFDIYVATISGIDVPLTAGTTYWLSLEDAVVPSGDFAFWDIGNGPSDAWVQGYGDMNGSYAPGTNSETFQVLGNAGPAPTPEPGSLLLLATGVVALLFLGGRKFAGRISRFDSPVDSAGAL